MALCPRCKHHFREPPDEQGDHGCPRCGLWPEDAARRDWEAAKEEPQADCSAIPVSEFVELSSGQKLRFDFELQFAPYSSEHGDSCLEDVWLRCVLINQGNGWGTHSVTAPTRWMIEEDFCRRSTSGGGGMSRETAQAVIQAIRKADRERAGTA